MQTKKDASAYPYHSEQDDGSEISEPGLTKREFFAAKAMEGLLVIAASQKLPHNIPTLAVKMADELIKALNTPNEN